MFDFIRGPLTSCPPDYIVVEAGGIGYKIFVPKNLFSLLPEEGTLVKIYLQHIKREHAETLYGFLNEQERSLFEILLNVSGVGPKMALTLIGHLGGEALQKAVHQENPALLCKVPGVGKKTAERLVMELRGKVTGWLPPLSSTAPQLPSPRTDAQPQLRDAVCALSNLGYSSSAAEQVLQRILSEQKEPMELSSLITLALRFM